MDSVSHFFNVTLRDWWRGYSDRDWASAKDKIAHAQKYHEEPRLTEREAKAIADHRIFRP